VGKLSRRTRHTKSSKPGVGSRRWLGWGLAGLFVVVALAVGLISGLSARSGSSVPATPPAIASRPAPTAQPSRSLAALATSTLLAVNPAGQVSTPAPQWEQLYALLSVPGGGWNLLVLHTNDTWGYLQPCG